MDIEVSGVIHAPLDKAWAWWTDYGAVGELFVIDHGISKTRRRIVSREGNVLTLEERGAGPKPGMLLVRHRVIVHADRHDIEEEIDWPIRNRSVWMLRAEGETTRVIRRFPRKGWAALAPRGLELRWLQRDLDAHVQTANRELVP